MIFLGKNSLKELKDAVISSVSDAVSSALRGFKNEEEEVIKLTQLINGLKKQVRTTKDELEEVKLTKKIESRDIEHLVKMKEEKQTIELQKKEIELQKQYNDKEMSLLKDHHAKTLNLIEQTKKEFQGLYQQIIDRLPNVNLEIKKGSK
jgi:vacuolar-type H+-ATPase subunit I/STV1